MRKFTVEDYQADIDRVACSTPEALRKAYESLESVDAELPADESAYWTLPRVNHEWRLPVDEPIPMHSDRLAMLPVRDEYYANNAYLAVVPQPIIMNRRVAEVLEDYALRLFEHFPEEDSLARREHDVPMMIGRFDVIVDKQGGIQICELDDVCSLWPALPRMNPIADSYLQELERQLGKPIYTAELFQYKDRPLDASPLVRREFAQITIFDDDGVDHVAYIPRTVSLELAIMQQNGLVWRDSQKTTDRDTDYYEGILRRAYLHNEDYWRGDINDAWLLKGERRKLDEVALSVRAFRDMPGFKAHLDRYGPRSITMAWQRDSKYSLVAEKLGALAANLDVAVAFGKMWQAEHPKELLVFKALYGARTEHTAIFSGRGTKLKGVSSASQIAKKFGSAANEPIVVQPFKEPDSLATAGVQFIGTDEENSGDGYTDRKLIRSVNHIGSDQPGERVVSGMENHFAMIFRSFVIYLPKEKRLVHVGGMWQATDGRIVHGGAHSVAGPLYVDGLMGHSRAIRSTNLVEAEHLLRVHGRVPEMSAV